MELKELDCPFCDKVGDWSVSGVEFIDTDVYIEAACPNCKKEVVVTAPILFSQMRMFVTPKSNKIKAKMLPIDAMSKES